MQTITLAKADPNLNFTSWPGGAIYGVQYNLFGVAKTPITYEILSGPGSILGGNIFTASSGTGEVIIRATAIGDLNFLTTYTDQKFELKKATMLSYVVGSFPTQPLVFKEKFELGVGKDPILTGRLSYELVNSEDASKVRFNGATIEALSGTGFIHHRLPIERKAEA